MPSNAARRSRKDAFRDRDRHRRKSRFGLLVDSLMGEEELVIKALDGQTSSSPIWSAALPFLAMEL